MRVILSYYCPVCIHVFSVDKSIFERHIRPCCDVCGRVGVDIRMDNDKACAGAARNAFDEAVEKEAHPNAALNEARKAQGRANLAKARAIRKANIAARAASREGESYAVI